MALLVWSCSDDTTGDEADGDSSLDLRDDGDLPSEDAPDGDDDGDVSDDGCVPATGEPTFDSYGGDLRLSLEATGFFTVQQVCSRWWLVTPEGHPFYSNGVNHISPRGDTGRDSGVAAYAQTVEAQYETLHEWADTTVARLQEWEFNTAGCWSDSNTMWTRMPYVLGMGLSHGNWMTGEVVDFFDESWVLLVESDVEQLAELADDPNLIGYFLDNEIRWGADHRSGDSLLQTYLMMGAESPGKRVAVDLLLSEWGSVDGVNEELGTDFADRDAMLAKTTGWSTIDRRDDLCTRFLEMAAHSYFSTTTAAIRAQDPNHLLLGNREVSIMTRLEVYQVAAEYMDVLSINNYVFADGLMEVSLILSGAPDPSHGFAALHDHVDLPILITEFGFRAADSGLPNSWPPIYPVYDTQEDRTEAFQEYVTEVQQVPWIVGYHWFEWVDQPVEGRFDGEDNNWGLVNEQDEPYTHITEAMTQTNPIIYGQLRIPVE